jgi:hypothetical protein
MGSRRRCCCAGPGPTKVCVTSSCGGTPIVGAVLDLYSGTTPVASGTTDSTGCYTFTQTGTYTVKVYVNGTLEESPTETLSGGTISISIGTPAGYICCGTYLIPESLTLTDAAGSLALDYCSSCSGTYPTWTGGHAVQQPSCTVATQDNICVANTPTVGPVRVCYQMSCNSGSSPVFSLIRSWSWVYGPGTGTPIWFQDSTGFVPGQYCITAPPTICGNPLTDTVSGSADPSSDGPFAISFDPTSYSPDPTATADPVGGSVAISA